MTEIEIIYRKIKNMLPSSAWVDFDTLYDAATLKSREKVVKVTQLGLQALCVEYTSGSAAQKISIALAKKYPNGIKIIDGAA